jgi:hypothetical protein
MSENRLWRLADELAAELDEFLKLKAEIAEVQSRFETRDPDTFEIRAIGTILHDVYQGAEGLCYRIAKEIDRRVPTEANWHRSLLDQMGKSITKTRPAVVQTQTINLLENYRTFRHRFRNIYGFNLDWMQMKPLLDNAPSVIDVFANDIEQFVAFLRLMVNEDEPPPDK